MTTLARMYCTILYYVFDHSAMRLWYGFEK
jgi:uncharacterized protein YhbP (UPF0306 family)